MIQPKKKPVIRKGNGYAYIPDTFAQEHKVDNFFCTTSAEEVLANIEPFELEGRKFITFDTETHPYFASSQDVPVTVVRRWVGTGKHAVPQDFPFCISICDGKKCYTLFDSVDNGFAEMKKLAPLLEDASVEKIAHNIKFDMHMLANAGMKIVGRLHDTVVLCKLINENRRSFTLKDLAAKLPGGIVKFEYMVDAYKQTAKVSRYDQIPRELLGEYANADVWNCYQVFCNEFPKRHEEAVTALYDNEMELTVALYAMERYGMPVSIEYEKPLKAELQKLADEAEQAIYNEAGCMFNINSTKQLYDVLMRLGVSPTLVAKTDKGNPKLDKNALANLADKHQVRIVQQILEYRKYSKLLTTYAEGIYSQRDAENRVHGSINQTEATTGRMSITKPALQTLPKKDKRIRSAFVPNANSDLWFFDLDQVEYRLFAHYAKAGSLLDAIAHGYDVHAATAATIFHKDLHEFVRLVSEGDEAATSARAKGKTINFALIYGVGISHLGDLLKCSESEASDLRARYFSNLPEAKVFISTVQQVVKIRGYIRNFYGRRRRLDPDDCYKAPNALIQGCAADYIKYKIVRMYKYLMYNKLTSRMVNVVHDEVVVNISKDEEHIAPILRWLMSDFETFRCPITAGAECGPTDWGHKEERDIGFAEPESTDFMKYDVFNGDVFNIYREEAM